MTLNPLNQLIVLLVAAACVGLLGIRVWKKWRGRPVAKRARRAKPQASVVSVAPVVKPMERSVAIAPLPAVSVAPETLNAQRSTLPFVEAEDTPLADNSDLTFGPVTKVLAALLPESSERRADLKKTLRNAGYYEPHAWHNLAAARYLGVSIPIVLGLGLLVVAPRETEPLIIAALVLLPAIGWALPTLLVRRQATDRLAEIEQSMPDLLDMMNMCVSQGLTVPASLQRVGADLQSVSPALSQELKIVSDHARVGSLEQALVAFSRRVDLPDVYSFTSLLVQTERMGTSMSQALADYSDGMRETLRQQADQKANTASFKLLFPTALCLMPAVFMILLGPAIIEMSSFFREGGNEVLNTSMQSAADYLE
ncbi:MAG: type II secretion system F family protein [Planctomycetaceae bacterium]|nr:type II secretion system F family protein [Planctomycetaceae bacterium]